MRFLDRLGGYFVQGMPGDAQGDPHREGVKTAGTPTRRAAPPETSFPSTASIKEKVIASGTNTFSIL
ncbi:MAG TPA: hypothetical protein VGG62_07855 [Terracidiphilus sp.]